MTKHSLLLFLLISVIVQEIKAQNVNHIDNFSNWINLTDNNIKKGRTNSAYYRILNCTTIANKKVGSVMHPFGKIEVKAPQELSNGRQLTGFINIAGEKNILSNNDVRVVKDTIQQFFNVSVQENIFSVDLVIDFFKIDNIYLTIFDNDISDVYSAKDDEANKKNNEPANNPGDTKKENKDDMTENQAKTIFDLIFGAGSSKDLTITNEDKKEARLLLTELIKGSCKMAVVEGLQSLDASILSLAESIYTMTSNCFDAKKKGRYYETVRKTIAYNFSSAFQIRKATGEW
ncbi:MAG: hypothetical protein QM763_12980 [Agriterribacter sp.]